MEHEKVPGNADSGVQFSTADNGRAADAVVTASVIRTRAFFGTKSAEAEQGEDGHGGVEHYPAECVHCGLCQDICPAQAITSSTAVPTIMLADGKTERYPMPDPAWTTGPDQILRKMTPQIQSREVQHSY